MIHGISNLPRLRDTGIKLSDVTPSKAENARYGSMPKSAMPSAHEAEMQVDPGENLRASAEATKSGDCRLQVLQTRSDRDAQSTRSEMTRNSGNSSTRVPRSPAAPNPPIIGGRLFRGASISFLEFLADRDCKRYCQVLFGSESTSAGMMLTEFRKGTGFHYYGHRRHKPGRRKPKNPGKLNASNTTSKKALKVFVRRAYRGDPDRRGVGFWERVAGHIWDAYDDLKALRRQAEKIRRQEIDRITRLPAKRNKVAARVRRHRAKLRAARQSNETPNGDEGERTAATPRQ